MALISTPIQPTYFAVYRFHIVFYKVPLNAHLKNGGQFSWVVGLPRELPADFQYSQSWLDP